jgi:hypothetical protein
LIGNRVGNYLSTGNLTTGDIAFDSFKHGETAWSRSDTEVTIPVPGWYEITFSATHWSSSEGSGSGSSDKKSQVDLIVNQQTKRTSYGTVGVIDWGQSIDKKWFVKLNEDDNINFRNRNPDTLIVDEENELFIKLQYITENPDCNTCS